MSVLHKGGMGLGADQGRAVSNEHSSYAESITWGEPVAIGFLEAQKITVNEAGAFRFTEFDGTPITI